MLACRQDAGGHASADHGRRGPRLPATGARRSRGGLHAWRRRPRAGDPGAAAARRAPDRTGRRPAGTAAHGSTPARGRLRPGDCSSPARRTLPVLPQALAAEGVAAADVILADLGVSSMQIDNPDRGFSYKEPGPLDMRMNPSRGEPAWQLLTRLSETQLASLLTTTPTSRTRRELPGCWRGSRRRRPTSSSAWCARGSAAALPELAKSDIKMSVRRTLPGASRRGE